MRDNAELDLPHVMARLINEPILAHPAKAEVFVGAILRHRGIEVNVAASAEFVQAPKAGPLQERRMVQRSGGEPYLFDPNSGIAVIPVKGSLAHKQGYIGASSGVMGYDGIGAQFQAALDSPSVKGIIVDEHTAGGEVHGAFQLADRIHAARGKKPIVALVDEMAYSAGYLIAAACDEIWLASSTAGVGSIGAVVVHLSFEKMLENEGVKATVIAFGKRKADGNPFQDLPEEARKQAQARIDYIGNEFVSRVARWRGISEDTVRETEAGVFLGQDGVKAGLANGIADPVSVFTALTRKINPGLRMA